MGPSPPVQTTTRTALPSRSSVAPMRRPVVVDDHVLDDVEPEVGQRGASQVAFVLTSSRG